MNEREHPISLSMLHPRSIERVGQLLLEADELSLRMQVLKRTPAERRRRSIETLEEDIAALGERVERLDFQRRYLSGGDAQ